MERQSARDWLFHPTQPNIIIKTGSVNIIDTSIVEAKNKQSKEGKRTDNT